MEDRVYLRICMLVQTKYVNYFNPMYVHTFVT